MVDDSPSVRKQIELELDFFAVDADYAADAAHAAALLAANHYDVAFLDVVLPDSDGFRICKQIKTSHRETTVIMLTGKASHADKVKGSLAGCDAYLVKPVGRITFQNTVKNYLQIGDSANAMGGIAAHAGTRTPNTDTIDEGDRRNGDQQGAGGR